jgi:hypothetical protein
MGSINTSKSVASFFGRVENPDFLGDLHEGTNLKLLLWKQNLLLSMSRSLMSKKQLKQS